MTQKCNLNNIFHESKGHFSNRKRALFVFSENLGGLGPPRFLRPCSHDVWTQDIAFYLDGTGFAYKRNPLDQALATIPNFKNFLSLNIFVQSLAEQKHALKIPEHTLIIMCNNKAGYN
jgi:hypothetical protein